MECSFILQLVKQLCCIGNKCQNAILNISLKGISQEEDISSYLGQDLKKKPQTKLSELNHKIIVSIDGKFD